jgi:hypothetical protein
MGAMSNYNEWAEELEVSRFGRKSLTLDKAKTLARFFPSGWYVAPLASGWTVGKTKAGKRRVKFPIMGCDGAPLTFRSAQDAVKFITSELAITTPTMLWCH